MTSLKDYITRRQLCELLEITPRTAESWAHKGFGPRVTRLGKKAYYHEKDISDFLEAQRKKGEVRFKAGANLSRRASRSSSACAPQSAA